MENSCFVHIQSLILDSEALDILIVLVSQTMLEQQVCDFKLFLDGSYHIRCEMVHSAFNVYVSRRLRILCQVLDNPSSHFYFILPDRNMEARIRPVVFGKDVCSVLYENLKNLDITVVGN